MKNTEKFYKLLFKIYNSNIHAQILLKYLKIYNYVIILFIIH